MNREASDHEALSSQLPGTWELESRIDVAGSGERRTEPALGEDAGLLIPDDVEGGAEIVRRIGVLPGPLVGVGALRKKCGSESW